MFVGLGFQQTDGNCMNEGADLDYVCSYKGKNEIMGKTVRKSLTHCLNHNECIENIDSLSLLSSFLINALV